ncbi:MAG: methyltransferase domain-containing protein [Methanotrichaceae archaeon]|nr:methyltransferase domain-containing protein [Methanotrichaceae archaeon]
MIEDIERHWSKDAKSYSKAVRTTLKSRKARASWQELFTEFLGPKKLKILDVGTGPGIVALMLAELGHDVTGVDFSSEMLEAARKNAAACNLSVDFRRGDAEELPIASSSYDAVVSRYVLWTIPDPMRAIYEWKRVLRPGGKIVIVDGNWYSNEDSIKRRAWHALSVILVVLTEWKNPFTHELDEELKSKLWSIRARRPDADRKMLEEAGFRDIRVRDGVNKRALTRLEYLKYGYQGDAFMISGTKT